MKSFNPDCPLKQAIGRGFSNPRIDTAMRGTLLGICLICADDVEFYRSGLELIVQGLDSSDGELMKKGLRDIQMKRRLKDHA